MISFLGIFSNNLDEFFQVRFASVKRIAFQLIYLAGTLLTKPTATAECDPFKLIYSWKCLNYNLW